MTKIPAFLSRPQWRQIIGAICAGLWMAAGAACRGDVPLDSFYAATPDAGVSLPPDGIFPQGRKLAYMGYSGDPARDLTNGFTVAGPTYGKQLPYLLKCALNGWPVVAQVGLPVKFNGAKTNALSLNKTNVQHEIERQIQALAGYKNIVWWAATPEELRPWSRPEMDYLQTVCETIRGNDPLHRPIYLYNPNHRDAKTLAPIARQVDVMAKGCYVNLTGRKHERGWVAWSVEQEIGAIRVAGRLGAIPLLMPELCADPDPAEDREIRTWVRHDVYLGMTSGAKGVLIWSLFPRKEVRRTWHLWYDAYAECGRELNGSRGLGQVFLFGERRSDLRVQLVEGDVTNHVTLGGNVEVTTTSEQERAARAIVRPAWTSAEYAYGDGHWLFLINSANTPIRMVITGWPSGSQAEDAFSGAAMALKDDELHVTMAGNGVMVLRFSAR